MSPKTTSRPVGERSNSVISPDVAPMDEMAVTDLLGDFHPFEGSEQLHDALVWTATLGADRRVSLPDGTEVVLLDLGALDEATPDPYVEHVVGLAANGASWMAVGGPKVSRHLLKHTSKRQGLRVGVAYYTSAGQSECIVAGGPVPITNRGEASVIPAWVRCRVDRGDDGRSAWTPLDWCRRSQSDDDTAAILRAIRDSDRVATVRAGAGELNVHREGTMLLSRFEVGSRNGYPVWRVDGTKAVDLTEGGLILKTLSKFSAKASAEALVEEGFALDEDPEDFETEAPEVG